MNVYHVPDISNRSRIAAQPHLLRNSKFARAALEARPELRAVLIPGEQKNHIGILLQYDARCLEQDHLSLELTQCTDLAYDPHLWITGKIELMTDASRVAGRNRWPWPIRNHDNFRLSK